MTTAYLFFADGELKVFLSELIARQYCPDGEHHFVTFTPRIKETWDIYPWASRNCLPWSHKSGVIDKYAGLRSRIHEILRTVGDICEGADEIVIHTYQIYSERINYLFNYLRNRYPHAELKVRLVPDGTLNLTRRPMRGIRKLPQLVNRLKWIGDPLIRPYAYSGDRLGADADIVDRIYLPRGFPNEYDPAKVYWVDVPRPKLACDPSRGKTALVIGTALTQTGLCTRQDVDAIARRIAEVLRDQGVEKAYYKLHHKELRDQLELWSPGCEMLETKQGIERLLLNHYFDVLIGACSTALLTSKLMYTDLNVISCGLEVVERRARRGASIHKYRSVCESLGIQLVSLEQSSRRSLPAGKAA